MFGRPNSEIVERNKQYKEARDAAKRKSEPIVEVLNYATDISLDEEYVYIHLKATPPREYFGKDEEPYSVDYKFPIDNLLSTIPEAACHNPLGLIGGYVHRLHVDQRELKTMIGSETAERAQAFSDAGKKAPSYCEMLRYAKYAAALKKLAMIDAMFKLLSLPIGYREDDIRVAIKNSIHVTD